MKGRDGTYIFWWKGRLRSTRKTSGRFAEFVIEEKTDFAATFYATDISEGD